MFVYMALYRLSADLVPSQSSSCCRWLPSRMTPTGGAESNYNVRRQTPARACACVCVCACVRACVL